MDWQKYWDEQASHEDPLIMHGYGIVPISGFMLYMRSLALNLQLNNQDTLFDIGGGTGFIASYLSLLVNKIVVFDISEKMILKGRDLFGDIDNVSFLLGALPNIKTDESPDKILCSSVLHYLNGYDEIELTFNLFRNILPQDGRVLMSANPDSKKKKEYIKGYEKVDLPPDAIREKQMASENSFWIDVGKILRIAKKTGFNAKVLQTDKHIWQSWYMFDLMSPSGMGKSLAFRRREGCGNVVA